MISEWRWYIGEVGFWTWAGEVARRAVCRAIGHRWGEEQLEYAPIEGNYITDAWRECLRCERWERTL